MHKSALDLCLMRRNRLLKCCGELTKGVSQVIASGLQWGTAGGDRTVAPHIMVVDDDQTQRFDLMGVVESFGFQVVGAADGRDALQKLATCPTSAILTDLVMPGMDGF